MKSSRQQPCSCRLRSACAQAYPETVVIVAPFPAGGSVDSSPAPSPGVMTRGAAGDCVEPPGASGNIGRSSGARARRRYTLLMARRRLQQSGGVSEARLRPHARLVPGEPRRHHDERARRASLATGALVRTFSRLAKAQPERSIPLQRRGKLESSRSRTFQHHVRREHRSRAL